MNGLCNLDNVVYQGIIYLKENVMDKKNLYWNFLHEMENYIRESLIFFLSWTYETPNSPI